MRGRDEGEGGGENARSVDAAVTRRLVAAQAGSVNKPGDSILCR